MLTLFNQGGGGVKPPTKIFNNSWTSEGIKLIFGDFPKI